MPDNASAIRVMLVDDHQTMLWGLTKLIESAHHRMQTVATAASCDEALASCHQVNADIILLDLDLNGESSINILPDLLQRSGARVIVLTGVRDRAVLDTAVVLGARGILSKDANAELVLKAIEKVHDGELWLDQETLGRVFGQMLGRPQKKDEGNDAHHALTSKERKVISTLVQCGGLHNRELAKQLFVSEHTLRNHLTSIYHKLNVANRLELYVYASKHNLGI